jgi:hypothetical protein
MTADGYDPGAVGLFCAAFTVIGLVGMAITAEAWTWAARAIRRRRQRRPPAR